MRLRINVILLVVAMIAGVSFVAPGTALQRKASQRKSDPISGQWDASFQGENASTLFTLTLNLKLDGNKVSGTYESPHTGAGNISNGSWTANKLSLILETNHGAMALNGRLDKGKLTGGFDLGQMRGQWEARKK